MGILFKLGEAAVEFGDLLRRQVRVNPTKLFTELFPNLFDKCAFSSVGIGRIFSMSSEVLMARNYSRSPGRQVVNSRPHFSIRPSHDPREILKKLRQIELRTNRLMSDTISTQRQTRPTFTP